MSHRRIETEEQYFKSLEWLVEKARQMEHPLLDEDGRSRLMQQYNFVSDAIADYNRRWYADRDPDMRGIYEELGFIEPEVVQGELTDWLDDE